jgi:20S proteasome alpha/beta subunit
VTREILLGQPEGRTMTYIAAFKCNEGIVMCADTQETIESRSGYGAEKQYSEKLYAIESRSYPLAIGGAGLSEPMEALSQEVMTRAENEQPATIRQLRDLVSAAIEYVYEHDVPISAWPAQYRTVEYLLAAHLSRWVCNL